MPKYWKMKTVTCPDCKSDREIRSDSTANLCRSCTGSLNSKKVDQEKRKTGINTACEVCHGLFYKRPSEPNRKTCSIACNRLKHASKVKSELRSCKFCDQFFEYKKYDSSNSSGTYCSKTCRDDGYRRDAVRYGNTYKRPRWRSTRISFLKKNPFCCYCGRTDLPLDVHHIMPYRMTQDNSDNNLVSLCRPHHSRFEKLSDIIAKLPPDKAWVLAASVGWRFQYRWYRIAELLNFKRKDIDEGRFKIRTHSTKKAKAIQEELKKA